MKPSSSGTAALLLACVLACAGCNYDKPWVFGISSSVYGDKRSENDCVCVPEGSGPHSEVAVLAFLCLPYLLDIVFLPITLTHDAIVCD